MRGNLFRVPAAVVSDGAAVLGNTEDAEDRCRRDALLRIAT